MGFHWRALASALGCAATVLAHGHVTNIIVNGVEYMGFKVNEHPYAWPAPPIVVGWWATNTDNGFVAPNKFRDPDIICHRGGIPAKGHARVQAGDKIMLQWNDWPTSHKGPVLDYLARCSGDCETVDKTSLRFFKIGEGSYISGDAPGFWAADVLVQNRNAWVVQIPADIAPGNYVLRHEIIALHESPNENGAQAYPQCFNLEISGSGTRQPEGVAGTSLYRSTDPGIRFPLYQSPINYTVPGPPLIPGVPSTVAQVRTVATATSSAIVPGEGSGASSTRSSTSATSTSASSSEQPPQPTPPPTQDGGSCGGPVSSSRSGQTLWGQCGGSGWSGPTVCATGTCSIQHGWYHQCTPA